MREPTHHGCARAADLGGRLAGAAGREGKPCKVPQERVVELAESPGEAGCSWSRACATTAATAVNTSVAKSVGVDEARPPGIAKYRATTESELAKLSGKAGSSESGAKGTTSADVTAVAKSVAEARPPGIENCSASTESEFSKVF